MPHLWECEGYREGRFLSKLHEVFTWLITFSPFNYNIIYLRLNVPNIVEITTRVDFSKT